MVQAVVFFAASAAILRLSWRSLGAPRSHGFYRFFAFELLLILILLNARDWFREPFSARQIVSWLLLAASVALAIEGSRALRLVGKPAHKAARDANLAFENTTTLVTVGAYRFIRHPMYTSLLALGCGACLKHPSAISVGLALTTTGFLVATSVAEERENLARFGTAYAAYMKMTWRFIPFVV